MGGMGGMGGMGEGASEFHFDGMDGFGHQAHRAKPQPMYGKGSPVRRLTPKRFPDKKANNEWLVHYYRMDDETSGEFKKHVEVITQDLGGKVKVGAINCEKYRKFCAKQGITAFPTFAYIWKGQQELYHGELDEHQVYNFAIEKHIARMQRMWDKGEIEELHSGNQAKLCNIGKEANPASSNLCAIFVLSKNSKVRAKEMQIAQEVAKKFRANKSFRMAYVEWGSQRRALERLIGTTDGSPTLLILRSKRGTTRFAVHSPKSFTADALSRTMDRAVGGDLTMAKVPASGISFR